MSVLIGLVIAAGVAGLVICFAAFYQLGKQEGYKLGKAQGEANTRIQLEFEAQLKRIQARSWIEKQDKEWEELGIANVVESVRPAAGGRAEQDPSLLAHEEG
jgi:hypothetical protein